MPDCVKNPCSICKFRVHNIHKAIFCNICHFWTHMKCTSLSLSEYNDLTNSDCDGFCTNCLADMFPFDHFENGTDFLLALLDFQSSLNLDSSIMESKFSIHF